MSKIAIFENESTGFLPIFEDFLKVGFVHKFGVEPEEFSTATFISDIRKLNSPRTPTTWLPLN